MTWENILKKDVKELEKIAKELDKAVEMHKSQAERIREHIKEMKED
jgi:chaperonin cofactor prefoldin|tara:strand:- start:1654 stop:1791 length:138 start_codon:yes stop_codon:yes gene_type:complete